jgi:hypothetical protein
MRGQAVALMIAAFGVAATAHAQAAKPAEPGTAEHFIETARQIYAVEEPDLDPEPCAAPTQAEIVVCQQRDSVPDQRLPSPTDRARARDEMPPDPVPRAPDVFGLPPCKSQAVCMKVGRAPPPIYIIDLSKIPEALTPEDAALVFRAEDAPAEAASPAAASPAGAP